MRNKQVAENGFGVCLFKKEEEAGIWASVYVHMHKRERFQIRITPLGNA